MRSLNIIPIVHTTHDLGRLKDSILAGKAEVMASRVETDASLSVDWFWDELQTAIRSWNLEFRNVYVYQDALPVGPDESGVLEHRIVADLAAKGNPNYVTLAWLVSCGANLLGTEDPSLLLKEYQLVQRSFEPTGLVPEAVHPTANGLLKLRDDFIAKRVADSLPQNATGLLFMGMLHQIQTLLPEDIQVFYPFGKPSFDSITVRQQY